MSEISQFFSPIDIETVTDNSDLKELQFGKLFSIHSDLDNFPDLDNIDLAIVGVTEERNGTNNEGCKLAPDSVRSFLYKLYGGSFNVRVADLGNIRPGHSTEDTYYALKSTIDALVRRNIVPIIIGGSQDLTYAQFLGYKDLEQTINVVSIDSVFDLGNPDEDITNNSYLGKIILYQPNCQ